MIIQQLVACDVALVHARDSVIHQQVNIELRYLCGLSDRTVALAKVIAPFRVRRDPLNVPRDVRIRYPRGIAKLAPGRDPLSSSSR